MKFKSRLSSIVLMAVLFTFVFSTAAFAYTYYPSNNYYKSYSYNNYSNSYYNNYSNGYYSPYGYSTPKYTWNYNWSNYYKTPNYNQEQTPTPTPQPKPEPKPEPTPAPTPTPTTGLSANEQRMINLVNQERTSQGLEPLKVDMQLVKLARMKSQDMIDNDYFSHTSPTYGSPFDMMKTYGVSYRTAGENLAGASDVTKAHNNLMNSDGHRKNILSENYTHIGIGIVEGGKYGKMYTQLFIGK